MTNKIESNQKYSIPRIKSRKCVNGLDKSTLSRNIDSPSKLRNDK